MKPIASSAKPEVSGRKMLSEVMQEKLRAGHYSRRTEEAYLGWVRRYIRFHGGRHPRELREREVIGFGTRLCAKRRPRLVCDSGAP